LTRGDEAISVERAPLSTGAAPGPSGCRRPQRRKNCHNRMARCAPVRREEARWCAAVIPCPARRHSLFGAADLPASGAGKHPQVSVRNREIRHSGANGTNRDEWECLSLKCW